MGGWGVLWVFFLWYVCANTAGHCVVSAGGVRNKEDCGSSYNADDPPCFSCKTDTFPSMISVDQRQKLSVSLRDQERLAAN